MVKALYNLDNRSINLASFGICLFSLIIAKYYFEEFLGLDPCYLCITQRVFLLLAGIIFLISTIHNPKNLFKKVYSYVAIFFCSAGAYFSIKQLYLQSLPEDQVPQCGPPVEYLLETFSGFEVISMLVQGDGNCAKVQWEFLFISMRMGPGHIFSFNCYNSFSIKTSIVLRPIHNDYLTQPLLSKFDLKN